MRKRSTMDTKSKRMYQEKQRGVSLVPSPRQSSCSSSSSSSNGLHHTQLLPPFSPTAPSSYPPKPVSRSESAHPYPTTFVQADTSTFKHVVQLLTGSSETAKQATASAIPKPNSEPAKPHSHSHIPPIKKNTGFKLYERRNTLKSLNINPLIPVFSPRKHEAMSPSILDFPALVLSPVTPLIPDPFDRSRSNGATPTALDTQAEERAIRDKGFFLHPSPSSTPRDQKPRLLPLFPISSTGSSSSS